MYRAAAALAVILTASVHAGIIPISQTRFVDVTASAGDMHQHFDATDFGNFSKSAHLFDGFAKSDASQDSTIADASIFGGLSASVTTSGIGSGSGNSHCEVAFQLSAPTHFSADAMSHADSVIPYAIRLAGPSGDVFFEQVSTANSPHLHGSLVAGNYTLTLDAFVSVASGSLKSSGGTFNFTLIPSPPACLTLGAGLFFYRRRRE